MAEPCKYCPVQHSWVSADYEDCVGCSGCSPVAI